MGHTFKDNCGNIKAILKSQTKIVGFLLQILRIDFMIDKNIEVSYLSIDAYKPS